MHGGPILKERIEEFGHQMSEWDEIMRARQVYLYRFADGGVGIAPERDPDR